MSMSTERPRPPMQLFRDQIETGIKTGRRAVMKNVQENILVDTPRNRPQGYERMLHSFFGHQDGEAFHPAIFGSHKSHNGAFPMMEEAEYVRQIANIHLPREKQFQGSVLLVANTIGTSQTEEVVKYWELVQPVLAKLSVKKIVPILRGKDAEKLEPGEKEMHMRRQGRELSDALKERLIPLVLPEASVESGRQKEGGAPGEIKGMIHLEPSAVLYIARSMERQKAKPLIIPMGNTGENRIYDPITEKVTKESMWKAAARTLPGGTIFVPPIMRANVGFPISSSAIERRLKDEGIYSRENFDQYMGELIANLLPEHERGVYSNPELLDLVGLPAAGFQQTK